MQRRDFLNVLSTCMLGATSLFPVCSQNPDRRGKGTSGTTPNFLFLFTDDQRFDTIHALGNTDIFTPNMDRLVRSGTAFTQAHIMGSSIPAVCAPSRAMMLTGRMLYHLPETLLLPYKFSEIERGESPYVTFPEVFRSAGYETFGTGKWHNGSSMYARGFTHGGNVFFGGMSDHLKVPVHDFHPEGTYPKEAEYTGENFSSELFTDAAIDFLQERGNDTPFLMYVSYTAPHDPRMAPKEFQEMYQSSQMPLPKNFMPEHPFDNGELQIRDERLAPFPRTPEVVQEHIAAYYAMISHLDYEIGRILDVLEKTGHADDTIIVFAGDNGLAVGQHGLLGKQNMYEHSVRVPLILSGPGIPQGGRNDAICYLFDIFPTMCELSGIPAPASVEGHSLLPLITGEKNSIYESAFAAYKDIQRMVKKDSYKLIEYYVNDERNTQLFDTKNDQWEMENLVEKKNYSDIAAMLREELARWQTMLDDPIRKP